MEYTRLRLVSGRDNHRDSSERDQARQSPRVYFMHRNKERDEDVAIAKVAGLPRTIDPLRYPLSQAGVGIPRTGLPFQDPQSS